MNISVTSMKNLFSFFCLKKQENVDSDKIDIDYNVLSKLKTDVTHGQYVAVLWSNKWVRGVVTKETQFLIWLIDYGIYLRPCQSTIFYELPREYKKLPTEVFEATIHGVVPVKKVVNKTCEISNSPSLEWQTGAVEIAQKLVNNAVQIYFIPLALLETKHNNIIVGDLYFKNSKGCIVNIVDELEKWPVFLKKDKESYINNLKYFYKSHTKHRACTEKPQLASNLAAIDLNLSLEAYAKLLVSEPQLEYEQNYDDEQNCDAHHSEVGSTVISFDKFKKGNISLDLTAAEIEKYSTMNININGRELNALQAILNKIKDIKMCQEYADCVSVGRACSRRACNKYL